MRLPGQASGEGCLVGPDGRGRSLAGGKQGYSQWRRGEGSVGHRRHRPFAPVLPVLGRRSHGRDDRGVDLRAGRHHQPNIGHRGRRWGREGAEAPAAPLPSGGIRLSGSTAGHAPADRGSRGAPGRGRRGDDGSAAAEVAVARAPSLHPPLLPAPWRGLLLPSPPRGGLPPRPGRVPRLPPPCRRPPSHPHRLHLRALHDQRRAGFFSAGDEEGTK
mmetsp:Transcript_47779/g.144485  ORF Transcript_47779/g.144485 Transcript_47779/m.144485 type:complete len:216 (+) Transcript_47779:2323-2970(+)